MNRFKATLEPVPHGGLFVVVPTEVAASAHVAHGASGFLIGRRAHIAAPGNRVVVAVNGVTGPGAGRGLYASSAVASTPATAARHRAISDSRQLRVRPGSKRRSATRARARSF